MRTPAFQLVRPASPGGFQTAQYPEAGVSLALPRSWTAVTVHPPLVALVTSGRAVISLWRYPRASAPPSTREQLQGDLHRLLTSARSRNPSLRVLRASTGTVAGYPSLEIQTIQRIGKTVRRVNSTHLFAPRREVVLEEYAPVDAFPALQTGVFAIVRRSLGALGR